MKTFIKLIIPALILIALFNGKWEAAYTVEEYHGSHNYLMDLNSNVFWDKPNFPTEQQFKNHFSNDPNPFPENGEITMKYRWGLVLSNFILLSEIVAFILSIILMIGYKTDPNLGSIARFCTAIAIICIPFMIVPGFAILLFIPGIIVGLIWARHFKKNQNQS